MTPEKYAEMSEKALGTLYLDAILDIRKDRWRKDDHEGKKGGSPRKRLHDIPLHLSKAFALRLREIAGTQKEVERSFYGVEDTGDTAAEGRKQRDYESSRSMPMWRARNAVSALAWRAFYTDDEDLLLEANYWLVRFDTISAARPLMRGMERRKNSSGYSRAVVAKGLKKSLAAFREALVAQARGRQEQRLSELSAYLADADLGTNLAH